MNLKTAANRIHTSIERIGVARTLHDLSLRAANRIILIKVLRGLTVECVDPKFLVCPEPYKPAFLDEKTLRKFSRDPGNDLTETFLDEALAHEDECYGILHGDALAAYGWYSRKPTRIDPPEFVLHPGDRYVYMYKGFTHPDHRGRRLHAVGMTQALQHYLDRGYKGLVSYVESNNFSSLTSTHRMGYKTFGSICVMRLFGMDFAHAGAGCHEVGVRVEPAARRPLSRVRALAGGARQ